MTAKTLRSEVDELEETAEERYLAFTKDKNSEWVEAFQRWNSEQESLSKKVQDLLPNALTAGLSSAFSEKKRSEEVEQKKHENAFRWSLGAMIVTSALPVLVSYNLLSDENTLSEVIADYPRLVLSFLPLYIPTFWAAYSSGKKAKLAKRLVEEYSHKEVLSRTFEGLSRQIEAIDEPEVSKKLHEKLLFNFLDASAENPGKLITDYNQADHPLMDALAKSAALGDSLDKLGHIPLVGPILRAVETRTKERVAVQSKMIAGGLDGLAVIDTKESSDEASEPLEGTDLS